MSLDVYLTMPGGATAEAEATERIYVRREGRTEEITRAEWDQHYPDREPVAVRLPDGEGEIYWRNITHNLGKMAREAGIYEPLWRPDEIGITKAGQLVAPLTDGLERLSNDPEKFKAFNPENGWGDYDGLVAFVAEYLAACVANPDADVRVSR